jgi:hypothetical protein
MIEKVLLLLILLPFNQAIAFDQSQMVDSEWEGSLMFEREEFKTLQDSIAIYKKKFSDSLNAGNLDDISVKNINKPSFSPSFFLNSLSYKSKDDWEIWLNDIKFTSQIDMRMTGIKKFQLVNIDTEYVEFALYTDKIDELSPTWQNQLKPIKDNVFQSHDTFITYYKDLGKIVFMLKQNHTFVLYDMQVVEGRKSFHALVNNSEDTDHLRFSPSFFLNALNYSSNEVYTIWLNDIQFTSKIAIQMRGIQEVRLLNINADSIELAIFTKNLDRLSPRWASKLKLTGKNTFSSPDNLINYYKDEDKVTFVLKPNQTFILHDMEIVEGRRPFHLLDSDE